MSSERILVIDVGAFGGASIEWGVIGKFVDIVGFEPNVVECERLNAERNKHVVRSQTFYPYAISGRTGPRKFYVTKSPTCSSIVEPNQREFCKYGEPGSLRNMRASVLEEIEIDTITLDDFCSREGIVPDFLKIDTQGSELEILEQGFRLNLEELIGLEVEVEFVELYKGQPLFSEVEVFLRNKGFELFGLKRHRWKMHDGRTCLHGTGGRMTFGDALFFHSRIFEKGLPLSAGEKATAICNRYRLNDVARVVMSIHGIDESKFARKMTEWNMLEKASSWKRVLQKLRRTPQHKDRGIIIEFDDNYGF